MEEITVVFPDPGGPAIKFIISLLSKLVFAATLWDSFKDFNFLTFDGFKSNNGEVEVIDKPERRSSRVSCRSIEKILENNDPGVVVIWLKKLEM